MRLLHGAVGIHGAIGILGAGLGAHIGRGLAALLLDEVIRYADQHKLMISLETHNPDNVPLYEHFGFKVFGVMEKHFALRQYCLVREA